MWDDILDLALTAMFVALSALVAGFLIALFLGGFWLFRTLAGQEQSNEEAPAPPTRLFGAPPGSRWLMAYDYWLYHLERVTGLEFNIDPARLLIGCVVISVGPAVITGLALDLVDPAPVLGWTAGLGLMGLFIGIITGRMQAAPLTGWFDSAPSHSGSKGGGRGFLDLGDDQ